MGGTQLPKKRLLAESKCALFRLHLLEIKTPFPFLRLQNEHIPHVKKKPNRPGGAGRRSRGGAPLGPGAEPPALGVFHMHVARHTSPKWGIASRTLFCPRVFALGSTTGDSHTRFHDRRLASLMAAPCDSVCSADSPPAGTAGIAGLPREAARCATSLRACRNPSTRS